MATIDYNINIATPLKNDRQISISNNKRLINTRNTSDSDLLY